VAPGFEKRPVLAPMLIANFLMKIAQTLMPLLRKTSAKNDAIIRCGCVAAIAGSHTKRSDRLRFGISPTSRFDPGYSGEIPQVPLWHILDCDEIKVLKRLQTGIPL
jgi:hypothetical protein